jgi:hypothetical protein
MVSSPFERAERVRKARAASGANGVTLRGRRAKRASEPARPKSEASEWERRREERGVSRTDGGRRVRRNWTGSQRELVWVGE